MKVVSTCNNLPFVERSQDTLSFTVQANGWVKTIDAENHITAIRESGIILPEEYQVAIIGAQVVITF